MTRSALLVIKLEDRTLVSLQLHSILQFRILCLTSILVAEEWQHFVTRSALLVIVLENRTLVSLQLHSILQFRHSMCDEYTRRGGMATFCDTINSVGNKIRR